MKEIITLVKGYVDDLAQMMLSLVAIGAISEVIFGSGIFGVNVIGNLTAIINSFGESGFAGLVALLVLVGLFRKQYYIGQIIKGGDHSEDSPFFNAQNYL